MWKDENGLLEACTGYMDFLQVNQAIIILQFFFTYLYNSFHYISPCFIHSCKSSAFLRHLRHNVRRAEDRFQIQPCSLDFEPLIQNLLKQQELAFPFSVKQNMAAHINSKPSNAATTELRTTTALSCTQCCYFNPLSTSFILW